MTAGHTKDFIKNRGSSLESQWGPGLIPGRGTDIPQVAHCDQQKKKKKKKRVITLLVILFRFLHFLELLENTSAYMILQSHSWAYIQTKL